MSFKKMIKVGLSIAAGGALIYLGVPFLKDILPDEPIIISESMSWMIEETGDLHFYDKF